MLLHRQAQLVDGALVQLRDTRLGHAELASDLPESFAAQVVQAQ
jgi:hypothetical protein